MDILATLLPSLIQAIPSLINMAETAFAGVPKSGVDKVDAVAQAVKAVTDKLADKKIIPEKPTDDALRGLIQGVFSQMQATGQLGSTAPADGKFYLIKGTITELQPKP